MPRILIADDEPRMLQGLRRASEGEGYGVDTVSDGDEALSKLRESPERCDVLVIDVMMPRLDCFELLAHLRQDPALQTLPVVIMMAEHNEWESNRLWKSRPTPYLWGDEQLEWVTPQGYPYEAYRVTVYKSNRPAILLAVAAALARHPRGSNKPIP